MNRRTIRVSLCALVALPLTGLLSPTIEAQSAADRFWGQWRGPSATGVSRTANPPTEWSETRNVRWKVPIAGRSSSSPIVWNDKIFLLTAVPVDPSTVAGLAPRGSVPPQTPHKFVVMALDRATGKTVWEQVVREATPHERHQENGTWASTSAVTDGEVVIASFESRGIYAFDLNGKKLWEKDLGDKQMRSQFGEGSTPALHGRHLVHVWDHQGESFIVALDKTTGAELWRQPRKEIDTWATPLITTVNGKAQVVTGAMNQMHAYDLETGAVVWYGPGLTMNPIPSPLVEDGIAVLMSGFRGNMARGVRLADAKGDITNSPALLWSYNRDTPYVPSPLLYDGMVYMLKSNNGILTVLNATTGEPHYALQRIEATPNVFSSPVAAAGRVYITGREGTTVVLKHGPTYEVLATNTLDDGFDSSAALVGGEMFLKGYRFLYCIAEK